MIEKDMNMVLLYDFYGDILTDKQADCIEFYYNEDLSLAEISKHMNITRQGVRDNIKRAESALVKMEEKLGLAGRFLNIQNKVKKIDKIIREIEGNPSVVYLNDDIKQGINSILEIVKETIDD